MTQRQKTGRNDPCPCGSGKKNKRCCLRSTATSSKSRIAPSSNVANLHQQRIQNDIHRQQHFGEVRPLIHADWQGEKWIAVGNELHHSKHWKTPIDFLCDYPKHCFTPTWGKQQLALPLADRHPVMQWYDSMCRFQAKQVPGENGVYGVVPNGAMRAYLLLSYDLYTLRHHSSLQQSLVERLKHKDQYQGARHELFSAATCIRAGFAIEFEDETDRSRKHMEFIAAHCHTGQKISVEAKSRHRRGVLATPGSRAPDEEVRVRVRGLINDALRKPACNPLVMFLDINLPPSSPAPLTQDWFRKIAAPIVDRQKCGDTDPWNLLLFTNYPDHYADDDCPAPAGYSVGLFGKEPHNAAAHPAAIKSVFDAALKFGNLPSSFDELQ